MGSSNVFRHKFLVEIRSQEIINELLVALLLRPSSLILEDNVVVPPSLDIECFRIEQRVAECNVFLSFVLCIFRPELLIFLFYLFNA